MTHATCAAMHEYNRGRYEWSSIPKLFIHRCTHIPLYRSFITLTEGKSTLQLRGVIAAPVDVHKLILLCRSSQPGLLRTLGTYSSSRHPCHCSFIAMVV